jgi:hypothetical protein
MHEFISKIFYTSLIISFLFLLLLSFLACNWPFLYNIIKREMISNMLLKFPLVRL